MAVPPALAEVSEPTARKVLTEYADERWDAAALERQKIGWTAWEYAGGFGVVDGPLGQPAVHAQTARPPRRVGAPSSPLARSY